MKKQAMEYMQQNDHQKALQVLNELEELGDPDPNLFWYRSECHLLGGNIPQAHIDIDKAMKILPGHPGPLTTLANIHMAEGKYENAIDILNMTIEMNGDEFPAAYLALADCYARLENGGKVLETLEKYVELSPTDLTVRFRLASLYARFPLGIGKALSHAEAVVAQNPNHNEARTLIANLRIQSGEAKEGESALRKLIQAEPNEPLHYARLASVLLSLKKFREAEGLLDQAQTIVQASGNPEPPFLKFVEAQLAYFYSDFSAALASLDKYLSSLSRAQNNERDDLPSTRAVQMFAARLYFWRFFQTVQDLSPLKNLLPKIAIVQPYQVEAAIKLISAKVENDDLRECFKRVMSLKTASQSREAEPVVLNLEEDLVNFIMSCQRGRTPIRPTFEADKEQ